MFLGNSAIQKLNGICTGYTMTNETHVHSVYTLIQPIRNAENLSGRGRQCFFSVKWLWKIIFSCKVMILPQNCVLLKSRNYTFFHVVFWTVLSQFVCLLTSKFKGFVCSTLLKKFLFSPVFDSFLFNWLPTTWIILNPWYFAQLLQRQLVDNVCFQLNHHILRIACQILAINLVPLYSRRFFHLL